MSRNHIASLSFAAVAVLAACASSPTGGNSGPASITISGGTGEYLIGEVRQLTAVVLDANGNAIPDAVVTWSTNAAVVATVSATGEVTSNGQGAATITAASGDVSAQRGVNVALGRMIGAAGGTIAAADLSVELIVPAGALAAPTAIKLNASTNPIQDPTESVGTTVEVWPASTVFAVPATLTRRFEPSLSPAGWPLSEHRLRRFDGAAWVKVAGGSADAGLTTAQAPITSGGLYSVGWALPDTACTSPESRQFDFWLGSWTVSEGAVQHGISDITLAPGGCAIFERYQSSSVGLSISFYVPSTGKWYQTYYDTNFPRLYMEGSFVAGGMNLHTPIPVGMNHGRTRWTQEGANVRQQVAAPTNNGGITYGAPQYNLLYTPR